MRNAKHSQRGFTLIELTVTVAIIAILATVAYPAYTKYVLRGYRSEGLSMLNDAVARMERYYAQNNSYANATLQSIGLSTTSVSSINSATGRYTLSLTPSPTATTYTVLATAANAQTSDACGNLSIDQAGNKTSSTGATDCFK
ncbi:type IV pilin protein [Pseudomonas sp. NPDC088444]|uniref:type IV pilin protein n=1 Tax=Pseudomonas sp. NPDC088444 TaxID=3364456 RepID=UPI00384BE593